MTERQPRLARIQRNFERFRPGVIDMLVAGAVVATALTGWQLVRANLALRATVETLEALRAQSLQIGDPLPAIEASRPGGGDVVRLSEIVPPGEPAVIAFLTTTCRYCDEMRPMWAEIAESAADRRIHFVSVLLDEDEPGAAFGGLPGTVVSISEPEARRSLAVPVVPMTVVLGRDGTVIRVWRGAQARRVTATILDVADSSPAGGG